MAYESQSHSFDLSQRELIDQLCDQFEKQWIAGDRPEIDSVLGQIPEVSRSELLVELVALDVEYRRRLGEHPVLDDYATRFPDFTETLASEIDWIAPVESPDSATSHSLDTVRISDPPVEPVETPLPSQVGRYRLESPAGRGGFGEVWRGFDPELKRKVAVKMLRMDHKSSRAHAEQLRSEAAKVAALSDSNIVPVYDIAEEGDRFYVISKWMEGGTLADQLRRNRLDVTEAVQVVASIADALHYAHLQDLIHLDVKPANILLDKDSRPHLSDFGLAVTEEEQLEAADQTIGTVAYMSVEQAKGRRQFLDGRSDIFSLGVVFYELLTGRLPFPGRKASEYLNQLLNRDPKIPRTVKPDVPIELERICLRCLEKEPKDRYATAADLAAELRHWQNSQSVVQTTHALPAVEPKKLSRSLGTLITLAAAMALVVGLAASAIFWKGSDPDADLATNRNDLPVDEVDKPPLVPVKHRWYPLLSEEPTELWWPEFEEAAWNANLEQQKLVVNCPSTSLLQFHETNERSFKFQSQVFRNNWMGNSGLFFGHHTIESAEGLPIDRFQVIYVRGYQIKNEIAYRLQRDLIEFQFTAKGSIKRGNLEQVAVYHITKPPNDGAVLEITVRDGFLREVLWGGRPIPDFEDPIARHQDERFRVTGRLGAYNVSADTVYFDPKFMPL